MSAFKLLPNFESVKRILALRTSLECEVLQRIIWGYTYTANDGIKLEQKIIIIF